MYISRYIFRCIRVLLSFYIVNTINVKTLTKSKTVTIPTSYDSCYIIF